MLRPFRPAFESLEKREVFSTGLLIGLGNVGTSAPPTEPVAFSWGSTQLGSSLRSMRSGLDLPGDQNTAVFISGGNDANNQAVGHSFANLGPGTLLNTSAAAPKPVAINWGDGQADQALMGDGSVRFQTQVMHEEEDADDVNHITAESHDAVFAQMGRTGGGFLGLNGDRSQILIGLLER